MSPDRDPLAADVAALLEQIRAGSVDATNRLLKLLYKRFRLRAHAFMRNERHRRSLETDDVTDMALIRLLKYDEIVKASDLGQLDRAFGRAMRQAIIDYARKRQGDIDGGRLGREPLAEEVKDVLRRCREDGLHPADVLSLRGALDRLRSEQPRAAEVIQLRLFDAYSIEETAKALDVGTVTVKRDHRYGLAKLRGFLHSGDSS